MASVTSAKSTTARASRIEAILLALGVAVLVALPFFIYPIFVMKMMCFALFACAFNLLFGYTGLLSFGHAAFFGGAAYFTAHAVKVWGVGPEIGILIGVVGAALLGLVIGFFAIRRQGIYFAMITLALSQMFFFFCVQADFTGGEDGIQGVPRGYLPRPARPAGPVRDVLLRHGQFSARPFLCMADRQFALRHDSAIHPRE